jgi:hypothetical protein
VPPRTDAKVLVRGLSDPSTKVRNETTIALRGRIDALPWLRRAAKSNDADTSKRAEVLLAVAETQRQKQVKAAIDACIRDGQLDLFMEWHQYWKPENSADLWPVGERMSKAGRGLYQSEIAGKDTNYLETTINWILTQNGKTNYIDGPIEQNLGGVSYIRTRYIDTDGFDLAFINVSEKLWRTKLGGGYLFSQARVEAGFVSGCFLAVDGGLEGRRYYRREQKDTVSRPKCGASVVVSRGNVTDCESVLEAILLVDGDIDLTQAMTRNSLIRATGQIHMPKEHKPKDCRFEPFVKNATAPYRFFELSDVGLSLADDEEGLVVVSVKPNTPFGESGLLPGDIIRAIDDRDAGHSENFRKQVRTAAVRQGDCIITIIRGDNTLDCVAFFPISK